MNKPTEKETKLDVVLPQTGFPKTLYFNRLRVDRDEGFFLVQFGLVVASDLVDSYSCVLTEDMLKHNERALMDYVTKLGPVEAEDASWKGATASRKADVADIVTMSFKGDLSETAFYVFSMNAATNAARALAVGANGSLSSQPLVLLRSTKALQKQFITTLYGGA